MPAAARTQIASLQGYLETLLANIPPDLPFVHADIGLIERVQENLLYNAVRHTPVGRQVEVNLTDDAGQVRVQVDDTGCGIPPEELTFVFDRFYQVGKSEREACGQPGLLTDLPMMPYRHGCTMERMSQIPISVLREHRLGTFGLFASQWEKNNMSVAIKNRVPHIIFLYWVIKIASTTLGETGADMFSMTFDLGYGTTIVMFMAIFLLFYVIKMRCKRYEPISYWLTFTATAIAGTAVSDYIDRTLGLGYAAGSLVLVFLLVAVLAFWYLKERSLSVENITTPSAETFYWLAFLIANTLGTAAGDFLADGLGAGFLFSAALIGGLIAVTALLHYYTRISGILLFWIAFVLTRPFGATFGDFLTKPIESGGVDLGTIGASLFFLVVLVLALAQEVRVERARS